MQVWDLEMQQHRPALKGHCRPVQRLQLAEGLLCSIAGQIVCLWDPKTLTCQSVLHLSKTGGALWALTATCCDSQLYLLAGGQVRPDGGAVPQRAVSPAEYQQPHIDELVEL